MHYYVCSCGKTGRAQTSAEVARAQGDRHAVQIAYFDRSDAEHTVSVQPLDVVPLIRPIVFNVTVRS
jgi:hypothetical protein